MKLRYVEDICGNDLLEDIDNQHQVMMEWEKPYMEKCIEMLEPSGHVLEIGFGMGYSAHKICSNSNVVAYTIIECSPVVWEKIEEFKLKYKNSRPELEITLVKGRWQDILDTVDIYDRVFFDDYIGLSFQENLDRFNKFLYEILSNHSRIGTKIGLYSTADKFTKLDCIKTTVTKLEINIPTNCKYTKGNTMYIPVIEKIEECEKDLKNKLFGKPVSIPSKVEKPPTICTNIVVIDNFLDNPLETHQYAQRQDFTIIGKFPGKRSVSFANDSIKSCIEKYIKSSSGRIIDFNTNKTDTNFNGSYEYTNSYDRSYVRYGKDSTYNNNWCGILYLYHSFSIMSGVTLYVPKFKCMSQDNSNDKDIFLENYSHDMTRWDKQDTIINKYNRLVLFRANQYYSCDNYFGNNDIDGRLVQLFFFTTEN